MEFAVNYSPLLAELVKEGEVQVDRFKCPAWPDLIEEAQKVLPVYVHFPLTIGNNLGYPVDAETKAPADLDRVAAIMEGSGTPYVNTHMVPSAANYPHIPLDSTAPEYIRQVIDGALRDLEPLINRFGAERVLIENIINEYGWLTLGTLPEVFGRLLEETGCGFLFDLSHARLTARNLGLDEREYAASLPVDQIHEVHVTGLQRLEGELLRKLQSTGSLGGYSSMVGKYIDHVPMTGKDWPELEWMCEQIRKPGSRWNEPWVVSFECGGVGDFWEQVTEREVYLTQLPRMKTIIANTVSNLP